MVIFLDFDGVLHPNEVTKPVNKPLRLDVPGHLFMHAKVLEELIATYDVSIVLSSSWVRMLGFSVTRRKMPKTLAKRVVGATWHSGMVDVVSYPYSIGSKLADPFNYMSRYQQIKHYVEQHEIKNWLAIDDLHSGTEIESWPIEMRKHLVLTDGELGISCIKAQQELTKKLNMDDRS